MKLTREQLVKECQAIRARGLERTRENLENARSLIQSMKMVLQERLHNFRSWHEPEEFGIGVFEIPFIVRYVSKDTKVWYAKVDSNGKIYIRKLEGYLQADSDWLELGE